MATVHGSVGEFSGVAEEWPPYIERMEFYFAANDVEDEGKKRAILLSCCGSATYSLIRNLVAPGKPSETTFKNIVEKVQTHFNPRPSPIVQRFKFNSRSQQAGETLAAYVAELRRLSEHCDYGDELEEMLRDRLVCGIADKRYQQRLLGEVDLTFDKAFKMAQAMELAERDSQQLKPAEITPIQKIDDQRYTRHTGQKVATSQNTCHRCGGRGHTPWNCRFRTVFCHACGRQGHLSKVCHSKMKDRAATSESKPVHSTEEVVSTIESHEYSLYPVSDEKGPAIQTIVSINGKPIQMEVDTGAAVTIVSESLWAEIWKPHPAPSLKPSSVRLRTYTGSPIPVLGTLSVKVHHNNQEIELPLIVVSGSGPSLLGRNWLTKIRLDWHSILATQVEESLTEVLQRHKGVFQEGLGKLEGTQVTLRVESEVQPKFYKARPLPFALRSKVEEELKRLESNGVIVPVQHSDWAAPIVPVRKPDGSVRICGDFKLTANTATKMEVFPLPRVEELFASLAGGQQFSKLDLSQAYHQLELTEESQPVLTVNTHKGLYQYQRLPFGVASAPAIFQRTMENVLQGIPNVCAYLDDILISGPTTSAHLKNLEEVLARLESSGMRLKREKCEYLKEEIEYLGHKISRSGLQPTKSKVQAVAEVPKPTNVAELRSFLGLVNYYGKFLPNLSSTAAPLYELLRKSTAWKWSDRQQTAFQKLKDCLQSANLLVHFDSRKEIILACDASPYGVGAVLSHIMEDGSERPIAYASRSLTAAERKYAHLDKEALAIVFGVKHFHQYIYGRPFVIHSDHKPLRYIFDETKQVPLMASARIQRWALTLGAYDYRIRYKSGSDNNNADGLSRLPLPHIPADVPQPAETVLLMERLDSSPVSAADIRQQTTQDPILSKVRNFVKTGWPSTVEHQTQLFFRMACELSVECGCLLRGNRVVVPTSLQGKVVQLLHEGHPGIVRMKSLARQYVWWPGIDNCLEESVRSCIPCQEARKSPPHAPLNPLEWPDRPWIRVHVDYAGPFMGHMFLILIDAHSKWMEVYPTSSSTSAVTIERLKQSFASFGLPEQLVTDNGPAFVSDEFQQFMKINGIQHIRTSPHHPASNGQAERAVQVFKSGIKKIQDGTMSTKLARFLLNYRITPHTVTGQSPAELMFGRRLKTRLDLLRPDLRKVVRDQQSRQKSAHDLRSRPREFAPGSDVFVQNFSSGPTWLAGIILQRRGPVSYLVKLQDGRIFRRHVDHVRVRTSSGNKALPDQELPWPDMPTNSSDSSVPTESGNQPTHRSSRSIRPPERYGNPISY